MTQKRLWPLQNLAPGQDEDDWPTPLHVFRPLVAEFDLELDVCANARNTKLREYFDREKDGLAQEWAPRRCWLNPPFGRTTHLWTEKAVTEARAGALVVGIFPAWTDRKWFHDHVLPFAEIRWIRGRVAFNSADNNGKSVPPWPVFVAIWRPK